MKSKWLRVQFNIDAISDAFVATAFYDDETDIRDIASRLYNIPEVLDREVVTDWACKVSGR